MKNISSLSFYMLLICGAVLLSNSQLKAQMIDPDKNFDSFKELFLSKYWELNPISATYNGLHDYDELLPIPNMEHYENLRQEYDNLLELLDKIIVEELSASNKTDYYLIQNLVDSKIWYLDKYKAHEWNPSIYNLAGAFDKLINSKQSSFEKVSSISQKLKNIPEYYSTARANLTDPTLEHTQLAIQQLEGGFDVYEKDIRALLDSKIKMKKKKSIDLELVKRDLNAATKSLKEFVDWLKNDLLVKLNSKPETARNFRLGHELYLEKFQLDLATAYTSDEIFRKGMGEKKVIHDKMKTITKRLWPKYYGYDLKIASMENVRQLIDKVSENHVSKDEFVSSIRKQIPELEKFVRDKDLLYLDPKKPLEVRETPAYMRVVAGASISAPGPFEKNLPTYYNVSPLDNYTDEEAESYLKEYNYYILQILNIHEAVPGHFTQLVYANKSPSLIKSLFGNGTMIEGWACYVERMMIEEGYGNNEDEMWLMYYKWNLRELCNALIDIGIHSKDWTEEKVLDILINEAFQENTEATEKWKRAQLSQVQLCSYYTGLTEIYELREEIKADKKDSFDLKLFHSDFLSYGSAPVKYIRQLMGYGESGSLNPQKP